MSVEKKGAKPFVPPPPRMSEPVPEVPKEVTPPEAVHTTGCAETARKFDTPTSKHTYEVCSCSCHPENSNVLLTTGSGLTSKPVAVTVTKPTLYEVRVYRCINTMCRIETFKGVGAIALNTCPLCAMLGTQTS